MKELWFRYQREGEFYSGAFSDGEDSTPHQLVVRVSWEQLLRALAREIAATPAGTPLLLVRADHPAMFPSRIPDETVELFRTDPVSAIREWTVRSADYRRAQVPPPVPAGHSVLARMFGEYLYLPMDPKRMRVESPVTGEMEEVSSLHFRDGSGWIPLRHVAQQWVLCSVEDLLLSSKADKFYLPRPWNEHGEWISRSQLWGKLSRYRTEVQKAVADL